MKFSLRPRVVTLYLRSFLALLLAMLLPRRRPVAECGLRVALYGHKLNGNLRALMDHLGSRPDVEVAFLTLDPGYVVSLRENGEVVKAAFTLADIRWVLGCDVIVTDHGPGIFQAFAGRPGLPPLVDVWHGVGFKGWMDCRLFRGYTRLLAPSEFVREGFYLAGGCPDSQVTVTGYALTDTLLAHAGPRHVTGPSSPRLLYAPTWAHEGFGGRDEFSHEQVAGLLEKLCRELGCSAVIRAHLNEVIDLASRPHITSMPMQEFPDTTALLLQTDILITDWSSIAADFAVLQRPLLLLNNPKPFMGDYLLGPEDRQSMLVLSLTELEQRLHTLLRDPGLREKHFTAADTLRDKAFGTMLDGHSAERCESVMRECVRR